MNNLLQEKIQNRIIQKSSNLLTALRQMDIIDKKLLFVFDGDKFINILSVGDIQRGLLNNLSLETSVDRVLRKKTRSAKTTELIEDIKEKMAEFRMECMPVLNEEGDLVKVYFWEDLFPVEQRRKDVKLELPVVIMAGGKGTRLKPITNVLPKPLIPLGEKTMLENIMDRFLDVGCNNFYLSVNYKSDMIRHYFSTLNNQNYRITYFEENKPLGTAGSLSLLKKSICKSFFVSNCDIIIDTEYDEILNYHYENNNELTVVSALKHYPIPYGTIQTSTNGRLTGLKEKPELTFQINAGMYILEPHLIEEIPQNEFFQITTLIDQIIERKGKVGVYPVSEGSWRDIGEWDEYLKNK